MTHGVGFVLLSAQKPPKGASCNGCGMCCQNEACGLSRDYIGSTVAPCVALEWTGAKYECGLIRGPLKYMANSTGVPDELLGPMFAHMLGAGRGCDSDAGFKTPLRSDA